MGDAGGTGLGQAKETLLGRGWGGGGGTRLPAPRCPVLTPCLSLRLQPSLVQPWQRPTRREGAPL